MSNEKDMPSHKDVETYGYDLSYSKSRDKWYASYDTGKGAAWYVWCGSEFFLITYSEIPNDLA